MPERDAARGDADQRLERVNIEKLGRRLASVGDALDEATDEPWRKALAAQLLKRSRRLREAMEERVTCTHPSASTRCASRRRSCATGSSWRPTAAPKQAAPHVRTIKRVQDMLGKLHDLQVLQTHVAAVQAEPRPAGHRRARRSRTLARNIEDQCRHLHGRYVASLPALREATAAVRKTIVPQLAHRPAASSAEDVAGGRRCDAREARSPRPRGAAATAARASARPMATLELYLIRHGAAAERGEEYPDDSKRPLTSAGISRLRKEAKALDALDVGFDHIISSPLVRTSRRPTSLPKR